MNEIEIDVVSNNSLMRSKSWPTYLCCRPMVGDYILEVGGIYSAKIKRITHVSRLNNLDGGYQPVLELFVDEE